MATAGVAVRAEGSLGMDETTPYEIHAPSADEPLQTLLELWILALDEQQLERLALRVLKMDPDEFAVWAWSHRVEP
jgi:hypothetical protein